MAEAKKAVAATAKYTCTAVCRYKDKTYAVGDTLEMGEREAEFLVNSGKFEKTSAKQVAATAGAKTTATTGSTKTTTENGGAQ